MLLAELKEKTADERRRTFERTASALRSLHVKVAADSRYPWSNQTLRRLRASEKLLKVVSILEMIGRRQEKP
jgi:hypothetical protein